MDKNNRNIVVIGAGSNIDPHNNMKKVRLLLEEHAVVIGESPMVITKPLGFTDQPDFLNGAFLVATPLTRDEFKCVLKSIETKLLRVRTENKNGPRTIDLDIIVWNNEIVNDDFFHRKFIRNAVDYLKSAFRPLPLPGVDEPRCEPGGSTAG